MIGPCASRRETRRQAQPAHPVVQGPHVGGVASEPRRPPLGFVEIDRPIERRHHLRRRREARGAGAAHALRVEVGEVERPAPGVAGRCRQPIDARDGEADAGHAFEALVGGEHDRVHLGLGRDVERQGAERRDGIDDHAPPQPAYHRADGGDVVADAGTGFAVDGADMADRGVGGKRGGDGGRIDLPVWLDGQFHDLPPGLAGQPHHALGVGAAHRDQQLGSGGQEGADRRLGDEMPAPGKRQGRVLVLSPARQGQHPPAKPRVELPERVVPRREVHVHGLAHLRPRGDRAGDQQQHDESFLRGRKPCHAASAKSTRMEAWLEHNRRRP